MVHSEINYKFKKCIVNYMHIFIMFISVFKYIVLKCEDYGFLELG